MDNIEYNPEYWTQPKTRDAMMPAFGALVMADYHHFLHADYTQARLTESNPLTSGWWDMYELDLGYKPTNEPRFELERGTGEVLGAMNQATRMVGYIAKECVAFWPPEGIIPLKNRLTAHQIDWQSSGNTYWQNIQNFEAQTRASGINAVLFFAMHKAIDNIEAEITDVTRDEFLDSIDTSEFLLALMQATQSYQGAWEIPDINLTIGGMMRRKRRFYDPGAGPILTETGIRKDILDEYAERRDSGRRLFRQEDEDLQRSTTWMHRPSSGCPVRHTKLGPNVQAAFTHEQRDWITSTVAEIDDNGVMSYTWNPFVASHRLAIDMTRRILAESEL